MLENKYWQQKGQFTPPPPVWEHLQSETERMGNIKAKHNASQHASSTWEKHWEQLQPIPIGVGEIKQTFVGDHSENRPLLKSGFPQGLGGKKKKKS